MFRRPPPIFPLLPLLGLLACASNDDLTDPTDPGPHAGVDRVTFWVYAPPADAVNPQKVDLVLRWKGNGLGPDADSPESSPVPWVGYAQPFRVEWEADFEDAPVSGYKIRTSQLVTGPFLPRDQADNSVFGDLTSWFFENATAAEDLQGQACEGGLDCPERVRFDSGPHVLEMIAENTNGLLSDREQGLLEFEINYPPETSFPVDGRSCGDDTHFPHYVFEPDQGGSVLCAIDAGDTVPMGSVVHFRLEGFDRTDPAASPPELCCDLRLNLDNPEVRYQARLELQTLDDHDQPYGYHTVFSEPQDSDVFSFEVGPFDYLISARGVDEHGRRDPSEATFQFRGGHQPTIAAVLPGEGDLLLLRDPQFPGDWPQNEIPHEVSAATVRYWDTAFSRYLSSPTPETVAIGGEWHRFPLGFTAASHPDEPEPNGVVAWAYEMLGEFDPGNLVTNGGGFDRIDEYVTAPVLNEWNLVGEDRVEIFVPSQFWENFDLLDPDGDCPVDYLCEVGELLRRHLGVHTLQVRGRTTGDGDIFEQGLPEAAGAPQPFIQIPVTGLGRRTEIFTRTIDLRIGRSDGDGNFIGAWPE